MSVGSRPCQVPAGPCPRNGRPARPVRADNGLPKLALGPGHVRSDGLFHAPHSGWRRPRARCRCRWRRGPIGSAAGHPRWSGPLAMAASCRSLPSPKVKTPEGKDKGVPDGGVVALQRQIGGAAVPGPGSWRPSRPGSARSGSGHPDGQIPRSLPWLTTPSRLIHPPLRLGHPRDKFFRLDILDSSGAHKGRDHQK
jgi:hypothetical protein